MINNNRIILFKYYIKLIPFFNKIYKRMKETKEYYPNGKIKYEGECLNGERNDKR